MGSLVLNVVRMALSLALLALTLWLTIGVPYPMMADSETWLWLGLSGFVGYVFGDYCLFQCYVLIGSRFGQLFMTLASPAAALTAWMLLGEQMSPLAMLGMVVTMTGIGMSVLNKRDNGGEENRVEENTEESDITENMLAGTHIAENMRAGTRRHTMSLTLKLPVKGVLMGIGAGIGQGVGLVLSKVGMEHYEIVSGGALGHMMPFASTMIRAVIGMVGFSVALFVLTRHGRQRFQQGIKDVKAVSCALGAATFGPFFGVSLSLMATLYTNAGIAQTIMAMTPVFILLPAHLLFHQRITRLEIIGAVISVIGVSLFFV